MDAQILQKILPKLHGNKKRIEPVLVNLATFCETGEMPSDKVTCQTGFNAMQAVKRIDPPAKGAADPVAFRRSYEKVCDMLDAVRRDQYVSFIR